MQKSPTPQVTFQLTLSGTVLVQVVSYVPYRKSVWQDNLGHMEKEMEETGNRNWKRKLETEN